MEYQKPAIKISGCPGSRQRFPTNAGNGAHVLAIEITVKRVELADTLGAMRIWLDREKCTISNFRHKNDDAAGSVILKADFLDQACAERFQQRFGGTVSN
jgi:hypothetical protein